MSIGVILPCRNSRALLARHLESLEAWIDVAEQVLVVDSGSTDGSVEYIKDNLKHPSISYHSHPPGLYQSWNHGISKIDSEYTYISAVGDEITRTGLLHLFDVAEGLNADVVISKPTFVDASDKAMPDIRWPIDDLISSLGVTAARKLTLLEIIVFTATNLDGTLLGSSASNIYRTSILRTYPFPEDFGKAGDAAWAIMNIDRSDWAVTPTKCSTFLIHPDQATPTERQLWRNSKPWDSLLQETLDRMDSLVPPDIGDLMDATSTWLSLKEKFDRMRQATFPWYLRPDAWLTRCQRGANRRRCRKLRRQMLC